MLLKPVPARPFPPIVVTVSGIRIDVMEDSPLRAWSPILVTPSGITAVPVHLLPGAEVSD
jgi:hypothetical protein